MLESRVDLAVNQTPAAIEFIAPAEVGTARADDSVNKNIRDDPWSLQLCAAAARPIYVPQLYLALSAIPILSGESTREPGLTGSCGLSSNCSTASAEKLKSKEPVPAGTSGWLRRRAARSPFDRLQLNSHLCPRARHSWQNFWVTSEGIIHRYLAKNSRCAQLFSEIRATIFRIFGMCADCSRTAQQDAMQTDGITRCASKSSHPAPFATSTPFVLLSAPSLANTSVCNSSYIGLITCAI